MIDKLEPIILASSFLLSIFSAVKTSQHNTKILKLEEENKKLTNEYNQLVKGQTEINIQNMIAASKKNVLDYCNYRSENPTKDAKIKKDRQDHLWGLQEENLNAYETACSLYLDEKIDKERFKKQYHKEIQNLIENEEIREKFFNNSVKVRFGAIEKVYKDWFNLEN